MINRFNDKKVIALKALLGADSELGQAMIIGHYYPYYKTLCRQLHADFY